MTKTKPHDRPCIVCGHICHDLSWSGRCKECSDKAVSDNIKSLKEYSGKNYDAWREGIIRASLNTPKIIYKDKKD